MSNFDYFRKRNAHKKAYAKEVNTRFVFNGLPSVEITLENNDTMMACVVNKQEKDTAYIYTHQDEPLAVGTVLIAKGLHFLIVEQIIIMQDVEFNKYLALLCNTQFDEWDWGYFKGPEESYINLSMKEDLAAISQQKPILVARQGRFNINDKVKVNGRPWLIIESDTISSPTIGYYSLKATTMSKDELQGDDTTLDDDEGILTALDNCTPVTTFQEVELPTEGGFYQSTCKLIQLKVTSDKINFKVPVGIKNFTVKTKQDGIIVERNFKVV